MFIPIARTNTVLLHGKLTENPFVELSHFIFDTMRVPCEDVRTFELVSKRQQPFRNSDTVHLVLYILTRYSIQLQT